MSESEIRPVVVRLDEYSKAMRSTADQMEALADTVDANFPDDPNRSTEPLRDAVKLYRLFANDLDKIVAGEELKPFIVTGNLDLQ
jgi:hypothetical protein